jgi:hypothetical protein
MYVDGFPPACPLQAHSGSWLLNLPPHDSIIASKPARTESAPNKMPLASRSQKYIANTIRQTPFLNTFSLGSGTRESSRVCGV